MFGGLDLEPSSNTRKCHLPNQCKSKSARQKEDNNRKKKKQEGDRQFVGEWRVSPESSTCRNLQAIGGNLQHLGSLRVQTTGTAGTS